MSKQLSKKMVKQMRDIAKSAVKVQQEVKYHCYAANSQSVSSSWTIHEISQVPNGDGGDDRDGNQCRSRYVDLKAFLLNQDTSNVFRVLLLRAYGDVPVAADLPTGTSIGAPLGCWRNRQKGTFKIVHDRLYSTNPTNLVKTIDLRLYDSAKLNFASASTASPENNGYYLCFISDSTLSSHPTISFETSLAFTDS